MRFEGCHGALPEERARVQPFLVDLEVEGDFAEAAARDDLTAALDYRDLYALAKDTIAGEHLDLLETLCDALAGRILALPRVVEVVVRISKPEVDLGGPLDRVAVEVFRRRQP